MTRHLLAGILLLFATGVSAQDAPSAQSQGPGGWQGQRGGRGGMMGMAHGTVGSVTEVASDHYIVKTELGEIYTIHYSVNTRIVKQPASQPQRGHGDEGERTPPQSIKPAEIKVGDVVMASGEVDANAKSVGAVLVVLLDPERAKEMRAMVANYGKTWLMGRVTAITEVKVSLQGGPDNAAHTFIADENTTFRKRRDPITLGDIQMGDVVRVEGAVKSGVFTATTVAVMSPRPNGGTEQGPRADGKDPVTAPHQ
jgi:hypothetical protein